MAEWLKILIGALAGLLVGILSEPLKSWTSGKLKEREMRSALYSTMADLLGFYESGRNRALRKQYPVGFIEASLEIFDHYNSTDKAAFYRLREAPWIKSFFHLVRQNFDDLAHQTGDEYEATLRAVLFSVESATEFGAIDSKRLRKLIAKGPSWRAQRDTDTA